MFTPNSPAVPGTAMVTEVMLEVGEMPREQAKPRRWGAKNFTISANLLQQGLRHKQFYSLITTAKNKELHTVHNLWVLLRNRANIGVTITSFRGSLQSMFCKHNYILPSLTEEKEASFGVFAVGKWSPRSANSVMAYRREILEQKSRRQPDAGIYRRLPALIT